METLIVILLVIAVGENVVKWFSPRRDEPKRLEENDDIDVEFDEFDMDPDMLAEYEMLVGRLEAAGFHIRKVEDESPDEIGGLRFAMADNWYCNRCGEDWTFLDLYEYMLLSAPTKKSPLVADWKRIGRVCVKCGCFDPNRRRRPGGILGTLLADNVNIKEMLSALRESDLDIPARIKAVADAQKRYWRHRIEAVETGNRRLLGPAREDGKKPD